MTNEIFTRRSIRRYLDKPVEADKVDRIIRAGMQAPSALDVQPWEFLVVTDPQKKEALSQMSPYAKMVKDAPVVLVICADAKRAKDGGEDVWWVQGLSACTQNVLLQIVKEGLGGVWLGFYPREKRTDQVKEYFHLPETVMPFAVIPFGYSEDENVFEDRYVPSKVHYEKW